MPLASDEYGALKHIAEFDFKGWEPAERAVLCFIRHNQNLLLIHKKTGLGKGKINAPGGRIETDESPAQAAVRETREETGVTPHNLQDQGQLTFLFTSGYSLTGRIFTTRQFSGTPCSTQEADPFWCPTYQIPYTRMWQDDIFWLPHVLAGKKIDARFLFAEDNMLSYDVRIYSAA